MTPETKNWYDLASVDLGVAKHLAATYHPQPLEIICYHCQQAAEKAIKALIVHYELPIGVPKVHDLSFLLNQLHDKIEISDDYYDYADALTPYGVAVRYPNELFLTENHVKQAIKYAAAIMQWADNLMNNPENQ